MNIVRRLLVDGTTGTRALFVVTVEAVAAVAAMVRRSLHFESFSNQH
jgi:phenylacetate-coenzyme A ligase PaaK-like adenylate-forming protein